MTTNGSAELSRAALRVSNISKTFPGTRALDSVDFSVSSGTIHALLGGNGSGKSTLIKILAGVLAPDPGGSIELFDATVDGERLNPRVAHDAGLRFVHQDLGLFDSLSIAENLAAGAEFERGKIKRLSWKRQNARARALMERFEISGDPTRTIKSLRPAQRTMVAVARAVKDDEKASILVLDEPTAALSQHESEQLLQILRRYADRGQTIILVTHRLDEVMATADAVTVLRDGRHVVTRPVAALDSPALVEYIVGRKLSRFYPSTHRRSSAPVVCRAEHLRGGPIRDASFEVHEGEILGIAGLLGSGRTELLRFLFGVDQVESGSVWLRGEAVRFDSPAPAIAAGVGLVPEDRAGQAAFATMSVRENLTISRIPTLTRLGRINQRAERAAAAELIKRCLVRTPSAEEHLASLSGGNQQKVMVGRWHRRNQRLPNVGLTAPP